ncbi:hypothetical protein [Desulfoluna spongiiphila]|uniref:EamA-like transporter family protein n=1 Tax=Desulfoluna spongiiphila TaxID=419481 RepID=A0A1G5IHA2_9BACT|nr:hypothetical protein [Desulfoluna spongiiphila]SCY75535.1 hypothetical protein SAMN05216233_12018 [Desulfoluna spongiiphila]
MSKSQILNCILCVVGISSGQLLFRAGALRIKGNGFQAFIDAVLQPYLWLAFGLYAATTLLWVHVLRTTALSFAYPWMALAFGLVPLMAFIIFDEPIGLNQIAGFVLIILGVTLSGVQ